MFLQKFPENHKWKEVYQSKRKQAMCLPNTYSSVPMTPYSSTQPQMRLYNTRAVAQLYPSQLQGHVPQESVKPWHRAVNREQMLTLSSTTRNSDRSTKTKERWLVYLVFFSQSV